MLKTCSLRFTLTVRIRPHPCLSLIDSRLPVNAEEIHQLDGRHTASTVSFLLNPHKHVTESGKNTYTAKPAVKPNHRPTNFHPIQNPVPSETGSATK